MGQSLDGLIGDRELHQGCYRRIAFASATPLVCDGNRGSVLVQLDVVEVGVQIEIVELRSVGVVGFLVVGLCL